MGNKELEARGNGIEEDKASYSVILFRGKDLPNKYAIFLIDTWKRSLRSGNEYYKLAEPRAYHKAYDTYIKVLLNRTDALVRLAVLSDDHDIILGWSLMEGDTLHYVHVKYEQRNQGIAKTLVPVSPKLITHLTRAGMEIWNNKFPKAEFNPF